MPATATPAVSTTTLALDIGGMTCASCAARISKRLNKLDGVEASVNYATEQATVTVSNDTTVDDLVAQVEAISYTATVPEPTSTVTTVEDAPHDDPQVRALRHRLIGATVLGVPVLLLSMINTLQFDNWQWLTLALAGPVVLW